jgi:hypothetical protein
MKCVSTHKVADSKGNIFFDARFLPAAASEQPDGVYHAAGKPAGKLDLQQLAAQQFETDTEYVITIEQVPPAPAAAGPGDAKTPAAAPTVTPAPEKAAAVPPPAPAPKVAPAPAK